jgi:hypothetical protein
LYSFFAQVQWKETDGRRDEDEDVQAGSATDWDRETKEPLSRLEPGNSLGNTAGLSSRTDLPTTEDVEPTTGVVQATIAEDAARGSEEDPTVRTSRLISLLILLVLCRVQRWT